MGLLAPRAVLCGPERNPADLGPTMGPTSTAPQPPIVLVRSCAECGRTYRPVFVLQRHCTEACEYRMHERERRRRRVPPPPECRSLYHREGGPEEPPWLTEALAPPPLPWETAAS